MKKQMNNRIYSSPSIKVMRMAMKKRFMLDTFSGGDEVNGITIDESSDTSGQINRSNTSVWDENL